MTLNDSVPARYPEDRSLDEDLGSWWVLHVKPNCEKMVATYMLNRNISYYFPVYEKKTKYGYWGKIRTAVVPLFRGYICFALEKDRHTLLYDTKKLVRIIKVEDQEAFVQELTAVARAVETGEEIIVSPGIIPGAKVYIASGPLEGTVGVVVRRKGAKQLALSVQMFNQSVLVKLDQFTKVEPL
jgi:transcription antitermination factor NusG